VFSALNTGFTLLMGVNMGNGGSMTKVKAMAMADVLEQLVDSVGFEAVLEALANVAADKAEHILATWQDDALANDYNKVANVLLKAQAKVKSILGE
jgi:hypothetical protein